MRLPKQFKLGGMVVTIEVNNDILHDNALGQAFPNENKILLAIKDRQTEFPKTKVEQTLYHEILHMVLDSLGYHELSSDEKFIQSVSLLLHQAINSLQYEKDLFSELK